MTTKGGVLDGDNGAAATDDDEDPDSPSLIDLGCVTNVCACDLADLKRGDIIEGAQGVRTINDGLVTPRQPPPTPREPWAVSPTTTQHSTRLQCPGICA